MMHRWPRGNANKQKWPPGSPFPWTNQGWGWERSLLVSDRRDRVRCIQHDRSRWRWDMPAVAPSPEGEKSPAGCRGGRQAPLLTAAAAVRGQGPSCPPEPAPRGAVLEQAPPPPRPLRLLSLR